MKKKKNAKSNSLEDILISGVIVGVVSVSTYAYLYAQEHKGAFKEKKDQLVGSVKKIFHKEENDSE